MAGIRLYAVDATTDAVLFELTPGVAIPRTLFPGTSFAIVAQVDPSLRVASVVFQLNGATVKIENSAPYALFGDNAGNITGGKLYADGSYVFDVVAYGSKNGTGQVLATSHVDFTVGATPPPSLTVDGPLSGDGFLNQVELGHDLTVTGTALNVGEGRSVTITLEGTTFSGIVTAGHWSIAIPTTFLAGLQQGSHTVTVDASNALGVAAPRVVAGLVVDSTADTGSDLALSSPVTDLGIGTVNNVPVATAGLDADASATITFSDGTRQVTAAVAANGALNVDLSALSDGSVTSRLHVTDRAGNTADLAGPSFHIDRSQPVLAIDRPIAGDNTINAQESVQGVTVSGSAKGLADGSSVAVSIEGHSYAATVSGAAWAVQVPAGLWQGLADGMHTVTVTGPSSSADSLTFRLDRTADAGADLALNPGTTMIGPDSVGHVGFTISGLDADAAGQLLLSDGTNTLSIDVTANGQVAADLSGFANGPVSARLMVSDGAGNTASASSAPLVIDRGAEVAPDAVDDSFGMKAGTALHGSVLLNDTDVNNDQLSATLTNTTTHGTLDLQSDGTFVYRPRGGYSGTDAFTYRVSDGTLTDTATVTITVDPQHVAFTAQTVFAQAGGAHSILAVDIDQDGHLDLLTALSSDKRLAWFRNDGTQHFTRNNLPQDLSGAFEATAVDIDRDGDMDLIGAGFTGNVLRWYENDGHQGFTSHLVASGLTNVHSVSAVDVDRDGDLDLVSAVQGQNRVVWLENDGRQSFALHVAASGEAGVREAHTVDFDGDGDVDILTASAFDDTVRWLENDGRGNFATHVVGTKADGARSVASGDLNGDGSLDIVAASTNDNTVRWYEAGPGGSFITHVVTTQAIGLYSVRVADLDGDGDLDLTSASQGDKSIRWYENDGAGHFTTHLLTNQLNGAIAVSTADLNGDGHMDILAVGQYANAGLWFEGLPASSLA